MSDEERRSGFSDVTGVRIGDSYYPSSTTSWLDVRPTGVDIRFTTDELSAPATYTITPYNEVNGQRALGTSVTLTVF